MAFRTLKASPLNNRGFAEPTESDAVGNIDPDGVAHPHIIYISHQGHPFRVHAFCLLPLFPQVVPTYGY